MYIFTPQKNYNFSIKYLLENVSTWTYGGCCSSCSTLLLFVALLSLSREISSAVPGVLRQFPILLSQDNMASRQVAPQELVWSLSELDKQQMTQCEETIGARYRWSESICQDFKLIYRKRRQHKYKYDQVVSFLCPLKNSSFSCQV